MDLTGQILSSQFQVIRKLGEGGMGQVYLAHQLDVGRDVVIKVMHPELTAGSPQAVERFKREARAVARLNHPHIVQLYVFGQTEQGLLYLAMEFVEGRSLSRALADARRLPEAQVLRIVDQVCSALADAHASGLIHRDLKPDNIMLANRHGNPDYVKVLDFGIAKMVGPGDSKMTQTGSFFGTPQYMAPEQAGGQVDARTDLYALGVILYQLLTGTHPFDADAPMAFLMKHASEPVQPPLVRFPSLVLSPRTEALVLRCLEKQPARRFQSAIELQQEIRRALHELPTAARGYPSPPQRPPSFEGDAQRSPSLRPATIPQPSTAGAFGGTASGAAPGRRFPSWVLGVAAVVVSLAGILGVTLYVYVSRSTVDGPISGPAGEGPFLGDPGTNIPPAGSPLRGLPVPQDARLVSSTTQALTVSTTLEPDAIIRFYAHHGQSWGALKPVAQGLQIFGATSPVSFISISPMPGGYFCSLMLTAAGAKLGSSGVSDTFGVSVPANAVEYMRTNDIVILHVPGPPKPVLDFYRELGKRAEDATVLETETSGNPYMVLTGKGPNRRFENIAIMVTPEGIRAGGPSMQISITRAKK